MQKKTELGIEKYTEKLYENSLKSKLINSYY